MRCWTSGAGRGSGSYEWSWTGSLTEWALQECTAEADRQYVLDVARSHRREWLAGYRKQLGFVTVVLRA